MELLRKGGGGQISYILETAIGNLIKCNKMKFFVHV